MIMTALFAIIYPKSAYSCFSINSWSDFIFAAASGKSVTFCPFTIDKPSADVFLVNKTISLSCVLAKQCHIRGRGTHFSLEGNSALSIQGFTLSGATESVIRVSGTTKHHILRDCVFFDNNARLNASLGGAAILMGSGTSMEIHSSRFFDNQASFGGAIAVKGSSSLFIESSIFQDNLALQGSVIFVQGSPGSFKIENNKFFGNMATYAMSGAIHFDKGEAAISHAQNLGVNNGECSGVYIAFRETCLPFQQLKLPPFELGQLRELKGGVHLSQGLKIRVIARSGELVNLPSQDANKNHISSIPFHMNPDGAAIFQSRKGGFVYVSNAESNKGGVYGLEFDRRGHPSEFRELLRGTSRNCAGGKTPWNTWISCEETLGGQCYQVDPENKRKAEVTKLGGKEGGAFEAFAYDDRNVSAPVFFVTEDAQNGALRRFRPKRSVRMGWELLHEDGFVDYLEFYGKNQFRWTASIAKGRKSAAENYQNTEGIVHHNGTLMFLSKVEKKIISLDLDRGYYTIKSTRQENLKGGGTFKDEPDQLLRISGKILFTEDGGSSPGLYVYSDNVWKTLAETNASRFAADETTGIAVSPSREFIFFCFQENGVLYQLSRVDGNPF